jgi:ribosomal protein S27AE
VLCLKSPKGKGRIGELKVRHIIGENIENVRYVFNDYICIANGKSSQIDHILVCAKGVFVIETKNYSGAIYGEDSEREWTQVLQYGNVKNKFYNPVKQNASHKYKIANILPKDTPVIAVVVFVKNNIQNIKSKYTIGVNELADFINGKPNVLNTMQINACYKVLLRANRREEISDRQHIDNIKNTQVDIKNNICPRCGKPLVLRNGKYGEFYGCSGYPKCRFIKHDD